MSPEPTADPRSNEPPPDAEGAGPPLPIDLRAAALALWAWRLWIAGAAVAAVVLGLALGSLLAEREFTAETVILYQPPAPNTPEANTTPSLLTLMNMVKLASNLEQVRSELGLEADARTLGSQVSVELQSKTTLVAIRTRWDSPRRAAEIANKVRDTFLANLGTLYRDDARGRAKELEERLAPVEASLREADEALRAFASENRLLDLTQEARAALDEQTAVNLLYDQALIEKRSIELQAANSERIVAELREQMKQEEQAAAALSDAMSETNIRIQRLRESIMDDRERRSNSAQLEEARLQLERTKLLYSRGGVSREELEEAQAKFRSLEAETVDTPQIQQWKKEMAELDAKVIPSSGGGASVTGNLLKDIMFRTFEIQLAQTTTEEKIASLSAARERVEKRIAALPDLSRRHAALTRAVESIEAEKKDLETRIAEANRLAEAGRPRFIVMKDAVAPSRASSSNAKLIAVAIAALVLGGAAAIALAAAVLDPRVRTARELALALPGVPVLGEIPVFPGATDGTDPRELDAVRAVARRLRTAVPQRGARILLVSAGHGEGTTSVAVALATVLARWDESVLLVDGAVRTRENAATATPRALPPQVAWLASLPSRGVQSHAGGGATIASLAEERGPGLAGLLRDPAMPAEAAIRATRIAGVRAIPAAAEAAVPDVLATERMRRVLEELAAAHTLVLVDGPPALLNADAANIARGADAVVLVAGAMGVHRGAVREAAERFAAVGVPVAGAILNRAAEPYAQRIG